jgi:SAM-dependent methyltransferase
MISPWLLSILRCPGCVHEDRGELVRDGDELVCSSCDARYMVHTDYVDMRPQIGVSGRETIYIDASADLDDPIIRAPVLSAGVRQRVLELLLRPHRGDRLLDIGCGNGKFAVWNRDAVDHMVGLDPAARFAAAARASVDLVQGDARALPFADGAFTGAYSIDVFEHLDLVGVRAHLTEARRAIGPTGRYFCFSNTRERSWLNRIIDPGRRAAEVLHRLGVVDRTRDHLRKGDHVKAVETADALTEEFGCAALRIAHLWYLNPLLATYVETLSFAIIERALARRGTSGMPVIEGHTHPAAPTIRDAAGQRRSVRVLLRIATAALMADVAFFRRVRTGPFFVLARPAERR